ncbi:MAG: DNA-directed RNA polymerase subunit omega [Acidobacteriota bacterium]
MDEIPEKIDSKFRFVLLAAQRAEQLMRAAPRQNDAPHDAVTRVAMREVLADELRWEYGAPPTPEVDEVDETEVAGDASYEPDAPSDS